MNCPVCDTNRSVEFFTKNDKTLLICDHCRHVFWREMPTSSELSAFYASQYTSEHGQEGVQKALLDYYRSHAAELAGVLGKPAEDLSIVDVGCSLPVFLGQAKTLGYRRVLGVDYASEAVEYGLEIGVEIISPDAFSDLPDNSFDILRYSHTLEHMIDPKTILSEQIRKLRPGGLLYITQPNFPVFKVGPGGDIKDSVWPTHLHYFNPISLHEIVDHAGADEIRFWTTGAAEAASELYKAYMDVESARSRCGKLAKIDGAERGSQASYPYFAGENSALYAIKR